MNEADYLTDLDIHAVEMHLQKVELLGQMQPGTVFDYLRRAILTLKELKEQERKFAEELKRYEGRIREEVAEAAEIYLEERRRF